MIGTMPMSLLRRPLRGALLICTILILSLLLFSLSPLDTALQALLYDPNGHAWLVDRNHRLLRWLFYDGVKLVYALLVIGGWLALALTFRRVSRLRGMRWRLLVVCLSLTLCPISVGILKAATEMPCPKQLQIYGGNMPHVTILQRLTGQAPRLQAVCYPAGHASGGFALMSLMFLFSSPLWQRRLLGLGLVIGWVIGGYKMLIGDHFLSHTWITMLWDGQLILIIAWLVSRWRYRSLEAFFPLECAF